MPAEAHFDKNGRLVYDADRRLDIRWADLIAAVNTTEALATILRHTEIELPEWEEWSLRRHLPTGIDDDERDGRDLTLADRESAVEWLLELRDRLRVELPWPLRDGQSGELTAEDVFARHFPGLTPEQIDARLS